MTEEEIRKLIKEELSILIKNDKYVFSKLIQILDGRNIQTGRTTGTSIGTATDQKVSVYGVAPVAQQTAITAPSGGATVDSEARTAINSLINRIKNFGISA